MSVGGSGSGGAFRVEHMIASLHKDNRSFVAYVDGEQVLAREAPNFEEGLVMLSRTLADLGRDGWKVDTVADTGYLKTVFLSRESSW